MSPRKSPDTPFQDPHADREAELYENPIPSRELILETLEREAKPLTQPQLAAVFSLFDAEREEALRRRLGAMMRDGQLACDRRGAYRPLKEEELIRGRVQGHPDGFGFLIPDDKSGDLLLTSKQMRLVFDGDIVLARAMGYDHKGRREATIVRVAERRTKSLVGRYYEDNGSAYVLPDNTRITQEVLIEGDTQGAEVGQFVSVEITDYPTHRLLATGRLVEVLGDYMAPGMEIDIAIRNYGIPHVWPAEVEQEVAGLSPEVLEKDKEGRVDLRKLPLCTIDGEDARDFDDAVYAEKRKGGGYRLIVAIADVSHYVKPGTALDIEAKARGNSVYFPEFVVPMLPEILSNGLCSLNPHVDRLCMVCDMTVSAAGKVSGAKFYEAVMHSQARFTYNKVSALLEQPNSELGRQVKKDHSEKVLESVYTLYELFKLFREVREARGALDFDSNETRIVFGKDRKIEKIVPVTRNQAHMLIEEMMLAANVASAAFVQKHEMPALYRNHEGPRDEKLNKLKNFLGAMGIEFTAGKKPLPADFQKILAKIAPRPDAHIIQTMLLRSLTQAVYAPDNLGHFGLAYKAYAHFTSPIRRYPDLLLHRAIRAVVRNQASASPLEKLNRSVRSILGNPVAVPGAATPVEMMSLGEHCSLTERRADEATRDVVAWLKCEYMQDRVGEDFDGVIAGVTSFGFFVELKEIFVEGLVHISNLRDDYYNFDQVMNRLTGERTGLSFSLGDTVRVRVAGVNLDDRKIDFQLLSQGQRRKAGSTREQLASGELLRKGAKGKDGGRSEKPAAKGGKTAPRKSGGKAPAKPASSKPAPAKSHGGSGKSKKPR